MVARRRRLRACAWLALLSVMALAVAPTVSRLLLPAGAAYLNEAGWQSLAAPAPVSSTALATRSAHHRHHDVAMAADAMPVAPHAPHAPAHDHALEHCALCVLAAHAFVFMQEPPALAAFVECTHPATDRVAPAPPPVRCDWSPASSRGPPLRAWLPESPQRG